MTNQPPPVEPSKPTKPANAAVAWMTKHKILTGVLAVLFIGGLMNLGAGKNDAESQSARPTVSATSAAERQEKSTAAPVETAKSEQTPTAVEPAGPGPTYDTATVEAVFLEKLGGRKIKDMCDPTFTHWGCFYEGVETTPGYLRVNLATDGGWSNTELAELATSTGRHWFNFIGCDYPGVDTVVVSINGIDHNTYRRQFPGMNC